MSNNKFSSPWWWVPTLYFAEGIPYFLVNNISVMMFTKMGVPNDQMSFFTTLLYFPWFLKGLWSPVIDIVKTKRWWIIIMQILMTAMMIILALTMPHPSAETISSGNTPISLFTFTLIIFIVIAFASATHDIAADGFYMLAHNPSSQAAFVGIRSTFYRISMVFGQGVLVVIAGLIENKTDNIPYSWQITIAVAAVVFLIITLYHIFFLPKSDEDTPRASDINPWHEMGNSFTTFFTKKGGWLAIAFMLLYRLPEGFLVKMCQPFLVASIQDGGLSMTTAEVGVIYGTIGVIALLLGGILGGIYSSRVGLKRALWPMALSLTLPSLVYVYLAICQPDNIYVIGTSIALETFGYGFGFTAYMLYMMYFSEGEFKTSHYAICTAFMALSMMLPGFVAGKIEMAVGYENFFYIVAATFIVTFFVTALVYRKIDPDYGKKIMKI